MRTTDGGGDFWFKPKSHGYGQSYGATPANWKGWLATLAFALAMLAFSLLWFGFNRRASTVSIGEWTVWLGGLAVASLGFTLHASGEAQNAGWCGWQ
jgi:hypothetical protein